MQVQNKEYESEVNIANSKHLAGFRVSGFIKF